MGQGDWSQPFAEKAHVYGGSLHSACMALDLHEMRVPQQFLLCVQARMRYDALIIECGMGTRCQGELAAT
jgi:hypothetical protein